MPIFWILLVGAAAAVAFWDRIREWASTTLADALGRLFGAGAREAFIELVVAADRIVSGIRATLRAWVETFRAAVLKALVAIERKARNRYVKKLTSFLRKTIGGEEKVYRVVVEEAVPFEDLPDDVRARLIRGEREVPQDVMTLSFMDPA